MQASSTERILKIRSLFLLVIAETTGMGLWFVTASVLDAMSLEGSLSSTREALLSSAVQIGFVAGALLSAVLGISDRYDPRKVFAVCSLLAAAANATLMLVTIGGGLAITLRFLTGALLAGVYPVGLKIAVGWGTSDRGFLVGLLVGALTLGSATPYLLAFFSGADWRSTVAISSALAAIGGMLVLFTTLGPHHQRANQFSLKHLRVAFASKPIRLALIGYLGHMWELYAMWSWLAAALIVSFGVSMNTLDATELAKLATFISIALGGIACVVGGLIADRIGKAKFCIVALSIGAIAAVCSAISLEGPPAITVAFVIIWGIAVIPDSAQFSALVADYSPPESAGSIMTLQTAVGFLLTFFTVQSVPVIVAATSWQVLFLLLALGPVIAIWAMTQLRKWQRANNAATMS